MSDMPSFSTWRYSISMIKGQPEAAIVRVPTFGELGEKLL
jgi:hypothetical protein